MAESTEVESKFKCEVTHTWETKMAHGLGVLVGIAGTNIVVCGCEFDESKIRVFSLQEDKEVWSTVLQGEPTGMTPVTLNGRDCMAISYGSWYMKIDFHDIKDLQTVVLSYSTPMKGPKRLCTSSPAVLLYEDEKTSRRQVKRLDCSTYPPEHMNEITKTEHFDMYGMCFAKNEDRQLLIIGESYSGLYAYDLDTGKRVWMKHGRIPGMMEEMCPHGVATDGRGHLFVCDNDNKCILMFSTGGEYLGQLIKEGELGLGAPTDIVWSEEASSLIVVHNLEKYSHISVIKLK